MIIVRAPFRISFLGGGTDFPAWHRQHGGAVISATVDKYCYIIARRLPPFFEYKHRIVWSKIELILQPQEISHPTVKEIFSYYGVSEQGMEIHHAADLPARIGMGASSSFTVALLHALCVLRGDGINKQSLAETAIHIEQERLKQHCGSQDQVAAAFGGLNRIDFELNGGFTVRPLSSKTADVLQSHIVLFFIGVQHNAQMIEQEKIARICDVKDDYQGLHELVVEGERCLSRQDMVGFGRLVTEGWERKRKLASCVTTDYVDFLIAKGLNNGALGGKLLGAGGGGVLCFLVEPEKQEAFKRTFKDLLHIPVKFSYVGSEVILSNGV